MYIPTPPGAPTGIVCRDEVYRTEYLTSALNMIRARYPLEVKRAKTEGVDWKEEWVTTIDPEVDLA